MIKFRLALLVLPMLLGLSVPGMAQTGLTELPNGCGTGAPHGGNNAGFMDSNGNACIAGAVTGTFTGTVAPQTASAPDNTVLAPTSSASNAIAPVANATATGTGVLKASAGNLYSIYANNPTATAGNLMVFNSATVPADGTVTPLICVSLPMETAAGNGMASARFSGMPPARFSAGISWALSSGTSCFTKATGTITGFVAGVFQ